MISKKDIEEIKEEIKKSENPLIFFDDDPDGLCSFLLFKSMKENAKGIVIKSSPSLDMNYLRKIDELSPDKVFVLDKPIIEQDFIDNVHIPLYWIDHHPIVKRKGLHYYNPRIDDDKDNSPVTYWSYKITNGPMWIATIGSIADWYIPPFLKEFKNKYPGLIKNENTPEKIIFETKLGILIKVFSFLLKGRISDIRKNISVLSRITSPYEIVEGQSARGKFLFRYYLKVKKNYDILLEQASKVDDEKIIIFTYPSSKMSFTSELSNELLYKHPNKLIIIGREKEDEIKLSLRSSNIVLPPLIKEALKNVKGYGGGHDFACGCSVAKDDFQTFIDNIKNQLK